MYFSFYPKVAYKLDDFDYVKSIDISSSIKIKNFLKAYKGILYNPYVIKNGERPEHVAYKVYGSEKYDWVILLGNDIHSIYEDWPKSSEDFIEYIELKYGSLEYATNNIKTYYDIYNNVIDLTTYNSLEPGLRSSETYYQYEMQKNDQKALIKIISPSLLITIEGNIRDILRGS